MLAVDVNSKNDLDNFFEEHLRDSNFIEELFAAPISAVTDYFYKNQNNNFELQQIVSIEDQTITLFASIPTFLLLCTQLKEISTSIILNLLQS